MYDLPIPGGAGEAAALFVQNWWQDVVADVFMKLTIFDIYHALPERHQPWFRETRQGWINATFEEVHEDALLLRSPVAVFGYQHPGAGRCLGHGGCK